MKTDNYLKHGVKAEVKVGMYFHKLTNIAKMHNGPIIRILFTKMSTSLPLCCLIKYRSVQNPHKSASFNYILFAIFILTLIIMNKRQIKY